MTRSMHIVHLRETTPLSPREAWRAAHRAQRVANGVERDARRAQRRRGDGITPASGPFSPAASTC